ncbi:chemotaxis protein CheA [Lentilitoribacter sp. Alg239-R112]|uniref:chemotaxis protein CheA n=1 Tax=Lentilitoribacter sp. Alg239-R112 TaxID=2305987 RepID=UPI0013A70BE2|nr:chemotaxis protein CheA [Lentilitoribacter sp. Alg239-R112]
MDMEEIKEIFFQECEEQLTELETGLLAMNDGDDDPETVNAVFRAVHSIKGGAGAFGLDDLVAFAHVFETTLDCVRSNKLEASEGLMKVMLKSADVLADITAASRDGDAIDPARSADLVKDLAAYANGETPSDSSDAAAPAPTAEAAPVEAVTEEAAPVVEAVAPTDDSGFQPVPFSFDDMDEETADEDEPAKGNTFSIEFKPNAGLYAKGNDTALLLRDLAALGEMKVACNTEDLPDLENMDPEDSYLTWTISLTTESDEEAIRAVFEFAEWDCKLEVKASAASANADDGADMVPVPFDLSMLEGDDEPATAQEVAAPAPTPVAAAPKPTPVAAPTPAPAPTPVPAKAAAPKDTAKKPKVAAAAPPQQIRVELDRVDRLINLVGELVINQAMLAQSVGENEETVSGSGNNINLGLDELNQLTREIQDSVMAIRAQPVKPVFQRMSRIVREIGDMVNKNVRLVTEGENTEVDKTVIDKLAEPLTHMIRNSVDHGLEDPETRVAAGKDPQGIVKLSAKHRSGRIVIEIEDDGAGINRERVKGKALENGLITPESNLSDEEIDNLIFHPGFSTAETLSDISGRGVGMDVVKKSIQSLGGRISIQSTPGKGSIFSMSLPLTLAVLDGMVVSVADQTLVVPLTAIVETLQPEKSDVHGFGAKERLISIRETFCPLIDVGQILNFRSEPADPIQGVALLVESEGGGQQALMVDGIQGQRQVVIKSLESNYSNVPGIAAATILGDGRVALILDVDMIVAATKGLSLSYEDNKSAAG